MTRDRARVVKSWRVDFALDLAVVYIHEETKCVSKAQFVLINAIINLKGV